MEKQKLKVITTFSGIGMQERGLENANLFDLDVLHTCETDIWAIISYAAIHNNLTEELVKTYSSYPSREEMAKELSEKHIGYDFKEKKEYDWKKKVNSKKDTLLQKTWLACHLNKNVGDITLVEKFPYCDLFTFSFPCFVEDTMVLTDKGYKKIQDIKVGTKVFTHLNRFRRVTRTFVNPCPNKLIEIKSEAVHDRILCTANHPFLVKRDNKIEFIQAKDLINTDLLCIPKLPLGITDMHSVINLNAPLSNFISSTYKLSQDTLKSVLEANKSVRDYDYDILSYALEDTKEEYIFIPFHSKEIENKEYFRTFNLEVEEDNSYVVENLIVHNCTDLSNAGQQKGMIKGETRSGLVYEVLRIIGNMDEKDRPRFMLMENVSALVNKKNLPVYEEINKEFKSLGYDVKYKVLEASLAGVAQHRERIFALYYKEDIKDFTFPLDFDCNMVLKDVLHKTVDEKYYVKHKGVRGLIESLLQKGTIKEEDFDITDNPDDYEMIRNIKCKKKVGK